MGRCQPRGQVRRSDAAGGPAVAWFVCAAGHACRSSDARRARRCGRASRLPRRHAARAPRPGLQQRGWACLVREVDVAGGVDEVERVRLAVLGGVPHARRVELDGDAALALQVHAVQVLGLRAGRGAGRGALAGRAPIGARARGAQLGRALHGSLERRLRSSQSAARHPIVCRQLLLDTPSHWMRASARGPQLARSPACPGPPPCLS